MIKKFVFAICLLHILGCATSLETVYVPAENSGWKVGYKSNRPGNTLVEFIPKNESISSWSQLFTIQFVEGERGSPQSFMQALKARMISRCPNSNWNVLAEDRLSITYEWSITGCAGHPDQNEIARLLKGNDGLHRIALTTKTRPLTFAEKDKWLKTFADAYVAKDGKRVVIP